MSCPGQLTTDPFYTYSLSGLPGGATRCYDGFTTGTRCSRRLTTDVTSFRMWPTPTPPTVCLWPCRQLRGRVVIPPGYELVKEEDKNILIGDAYVGPVTQQFAGFGNIYILPDQGRSKTRILIRLSRRRRRKQPHHQPGDASNTTMLFPPCVGNMHLVPDLLSLYPGAQQVAPFAEGLRPLCDRKKVVFNDQMQTNATFCIFTAAPMASTFTGIIRRRYRRVQRDSARLRREVCGAVRADLDQRL